MLLSDSFPHKYNFLRCTPQPLPESCRQMQEEQKLYMILLLKNFLSFQIKIKKLTIFELSVVLIVFLNFFEIDFL